MSKCGNSCKKNLTWDQKHVIRLFLFYNLKNCSRIWNQHSQICKNAKLWVRIKVLKYGTKNALFEYFWTITLKKLLSSFELVPANLLKRKVSFKNLAPKMAYASIFGLQFEKTKVIFGTNTLELVKLKLYVQK